MVLSYSNLKTLSTATVESVTDRDDLVETCNRFVGPLQSGECLHPVQPRTQNFHHHSRIGVGAVTLHDLAAPRECLLESLQLIQRSRGVDPCPPDRADHRGVGVCSEATHEVFVDGQRLGRAPTLYKGECLRDQRVGNLRMRGRIGVLVVDLDHLVAHVPNLVDAIEHLARLIERRADPTEHPDDSRHTGYELERHRCELKGVAEQRQRAL
jgi:hypothetical protein